MKHDSPRTVRIWILWKDSWVRLPLKPCKPVELFEGGETDEGYSMRWETYEYDSLEGVVRSTIHMEGRDCDGRSSYDWDGYWPVGGPTEPCLHFRDDGEQVELDIERPEWTRSNAYQRDYEAEAAGY